MNILDKILKAKVSLLVSQPWFGQLSCYLNFIERKEVESAAINERGDFFYNPKFIEGLTDRELKGLVSHEVLHLAYQHPFRVQTRDQVIFNIAADLKVNDELCSGYDSTVDLPKGGLLPSYGEWHCVNAKVENIKEKTTEQIYLELKKQAFKIPTFIIDLMKGQKGVDEVPSNQLPALAGEWKARIEAANAQMKGNVPEGLLRETQALENPELPWIQIIRQRLRAISKKLTWQKPNKKFLPFYFPGSIKRKGLTACTAIDTSGSMSNEQLKKALSEVWGLTQAFRNIKMFLLTCDADVWDKIELNNGNKGLLKKLRMRGGGGTDFRPVFKLIDKEFKNKIDCLIFFTDGYGDFPNKGPFYPVYWITDSRDIKFPFGRVIYLKET